MRGLSFPTRDWICIPCFGRWILNLWTTRDVPWRVIFSPMPLESPTYLYLFVSLSSSPCSLCLDYSHHSHFKHLPAEKFPVTFQGPHPYNIVSSQSIPTFMFPHHSLALTSSCIYMAHTSGWACPQWKGVCLGGPFIIPAQLLEASLGSRCIRP